MTQFLRPISTVAAGAWTPSGATVHEDLDEGIANADDGTTHISVSTDNSDAEVLIAPGEDPSTGAFHTFYWRAKASFRTGAWLLPGALIRVSLVEGSTIRATGEAYFYNYGTASYTLTAAEANAISDYTNLRFRVRLLNGSGQSADVSTIEMQIPSLEIIASQRGMIEGPSVRGSMRANSCRGLTASPELPIGLARSTSARGHPSSTTSYPGLVR